MNIAMLCLPCFKIAAPVMRPDLDSEQRSKSTYKCLGTMVLQKTAENQMD